MSLDVYRNYRSYSLYESIFFTTKKTHFTAIMLLPCDFRYEHIHNNERPCFKSRKDPTFLGGRQRSIVKSKKRYSSFSRDPTVTINHSDIYSKGILLYRTLTTSKLCVKINKHVVLYRIITLAVLPCTISFRLGKFGQNGTV